jgi:uncharacterized RDD family membrane protein YckC
MTIDAALTENVDTLQPAYARFPRRLRAVFIDWVIFVLVLVGTLIVAAAVGSDKLSRELGFAVAVLLLLYEPLLVWQTGSSVGHYLTNLRVVDNRTQGNPSFLRALARQIIKAVLGWHSFITMATTRRHQAVHDLLTGSTVQIRDPAKASTDHYVRESVVFSNPNMASRARRTMVTFAYLVALFVLLCVAVSGLILDGRVSRACAYQDRCSSSEGLLFDLVGLIWLASCVLVIVQGWRGRMPGCRPKRTA